MVVEMILDQLCHVNDSDNLVYSITVITDYFNAIVIHTKSINDYERQRDFLNFTAYPVVKLPASKFGAQFRLNVKITIKYFQSIMKFKVLKM